MLQVKVSGAWKKVSYPYVRVAGAWKNCQNVFTRVAGAWKPLWSYAWSVGGWGGCSAGCGGGTQTRTVTCLRGDGVTVADAYCTRAGLSKPATSQPCNTQSCTSCQYRSNWNPYYQLYSAGDYVWIAPYGYSDGLYGGSNLGGVVWNTLVVQGMAYNTTYVTKNGYAYSRSTLQKTAVFSVTDEVAATFAAYIVCRTPV